MILNAALFGILAALAIEVTSAYTAPSTPRVTTRKAFIATCASNVAAAAIMQTATIDNANAFDGAGSSAYSGRTPSSKAELQKSYQNRVVADVKDFKALGEAISNGETEGDAWVRFFIEFQRREADENGRTYAALADLVGIKDVSGCGLLLASSFAKPGKPADGLPSVKTYNAMSKTFEPIKAAGKKGDAKKAKAAYDKAVGPLSEYLEAVGLPSSLSDPIYS